MKKFGGGIAFLFCFLIAVSLAGCGRQDKYPDALKIGTMAIPKTLMPYASADSVNMFAAGLIYDTLLGNAEEPEGAAGGRYTYPDGMEHVPIDTAENYFKFEDRLVETAGAYPRKPGARYGFTAYDPSPAERAAQLERKRIREGFNETGNPKTETREEYVKRADEAVPERNWREYRFRVRGGYSWSDGTPFTAGDIEFTFKYILYNAGALGAVANFLANYYDCFAENDYDFVLKLASNKLSDIKTICNSILILPEHIWAPIRKPAEENNLNPVGTGAYTVPEGGYEAETQLYLKLRDNYDEGLMREYFAYEPLKEIILRRISDEEVLIQSIQKGDIDAGLLSIDEARAHSISEQNRAYDKVLIDEYASPYITTLAFNVGKNGALKDSNFNGRAAEIRKAVSLAIDQDALIERVLRGKADKVGDGLVLYGMPHALTDSGGNYVWHQTDAVKANALLDAAGYPRGADGKRGLSFAVYAGVSSEPLVRELGNMIESAIGVTITFTAAGNTFSEDVKQSNGASFDLILNTVVFDVDQLLMFDARFGVYADGTPRVWNRTGVNSAELTRLMYEMDTETDILAQYAKSKAVQEMIAGLYLEVPLYNARQFAVYSDTRFGGWIEMRAGGVLNRMSFRYLQRK